MSRSSWALRLSSVDLGSETGEVGDWCCAECGRVVVCVSCDAGGRGMSVRGLYRLLRQHERECVRMVGVA